MNKIDYIVKKYIVAVGCIFLVSHGARQLLLKKYGAEEFTMSVRVIEIKCPGCGAPVDISQKTCIYCKQPLVISTFNSVYDMPAPMVNRYANAYRQALSDNPEDRQLNNSIAMCYLKLKLYDKALDAFEKAMEDNFDNSETFFMLPFAF